MGPSRVAVIQPLPGIGDMIWHLAHIRAIAQHVGAPVTLIAKASARAEQLLAGEPAVRKVLRVERAERGARFGGLDLVPLLLRHRFRRVYLLHHSRSLAFATALAGVRERYGYGFGRQRAFLNRGPFLPPPALHLHPFDQATAWLEAAGIALPDPRPRLDVAVAARAVARERIGATGAPFAIFGIASSQANKQWGAESFAALARALLGAGWPRLVLAGGPAEAPLAAAIRAALGPEAPRLAEALGWELGLLAGLCAEAAFYVGNDTGAMNLAAAVGTRAYGLFGGTPPFHHSPEILPITPPDGRADPLSGMARITPTAVLAAIAADRGCLAPTDHAPA
jgi:heptosyltransferase-2